MLVGKEDLMIKRFLIAFGLVLLYMAVWAGILFLAISIAQNNEGVLLVLILGMFVLIVVLLVPYLDQVAKRVFHFKGEGDPVPVTELRELILSVNGFVDAPVMAEERQNAWTGRRALLVTWKYVDARWWEILAKAGLTQLYELHVKLDESQHVATLIDVHKSVDWRAGPTEVRLRGGLLRGLMFAYEIGKRWGIKENWELGKVYDYKFVPSEVKLPVMNSILRSGWSVRLGLW
jgi:hypothetical protein